jgi:hypothetical protein
MGYLVWYISDKNHTKRASIIKGWFKYMTDCKNFPDHRIYSSRKMAASRSLSPRIPGVTLTFKLRKTIRIQIKFINEMVPYSSCPNHEKSLICYRFEFWHDELRTVIGGSSGSGSILRY